MPNPLVVVVVLFEEMGPLPMGETWEMFRLAPAVVRLDESDQSIRLCLESFWLTTVLLLNLAQIRFTNAALCHSPLPPGLPPAFEILIDALAFNSAQTQDSHYLTLAESIQMVEQRHQGIAAYHSASRYRFEESA